MAYELYKKLKMQSSKGFLILIDFLNPKFSIKMIPWEINLAFSNNICVACIVFHSSKAPTEGGGLQPLQFAGGFFALD